MENKKIKVLYTLPTFDMGGAPVCILRLISNQNLICPIVVASKSISNSEYEFVKAGAIVHNINLNVISLISIIDLLKVIIKQRPDLVHTAGKSGLFYGIAISLFKYIFKFKIVHTYHGFDLKEGLIHNVFMRLIFSIYTLFCSESISVSESEYIKIAGSLFRFSRLPKIIHNGVAIKFDDIPKKIDLVLEQYDINIVSFSRINPQKDLIKMIECFEAISTSKNISLNIFGGYQPGDMEYHKEVMNKVSVSHKSKDIYFWGEVENVSGFMNKFDVYISSSKFEGLPTAIIEAFLSNVPVVCTPVVGNVDLVNEGCGYPARDNTTKSLSDALERCLDEIGSVQQSVLLDKAQQISFDFSIEKHQQLIFNLYANLR